MLAVDLGSRTTKAVCVQRRGQGLALCGFALLDAPIYEKSLPPELLCEHLKAVTQVLRPTTKFVALSATEILRRNLVIYGVGGLIAPFIGIKLIDMVLTALGVH